MEEIAILANQKAAEMIVKGMDTKALLYRHKAPGEKKLLRF